MALRVIGAGMGRTGTYSLKLGLERLLGRPCYHMREVFARPDHIAAWRRALGGEEPDWGFLLAGYVAAVDEPPAYFWRELAMIYPDAFVLLSTRPADDWYRSMDRTIFDVLRRGSSPNGAEWFAMVEAMFNVQFPAGTEDKDAAIVAYETHNERVRTTISRTRLIEWRPEDGWGPLCEALGLDEPREAFPHTNTTEEFRHNTRLNE